jgi:HAD superfamily hydrolase (TIGR01509 family)
MKIECVLFDLDGVLVDACDWHYESLNHALKECGHRPISREEHITKYNGLPTNIKLDMLGISGDDASQVWELKQEYTLNTIEKNAIDMPEKKELHEYLKSRGIKIACVTNSIRQTAEAMLCSTGQLEYMDLLVSNENVSKNKPHPDCYNKAIKDLGVDPSLCLCVEDSEKGIQAAKTSVAKNIWVVKNTTEVNKQAFVNYEKGLV